ncbi:MAG: DUF3307 domain-containing protein [Halanaeroarchaeum sp.]
MTGALTALGPDGTALALLVLGHVLGDFLFQTEAMAKDKHRIGPLLAHGGLVIVAQVLAFVPLVTVKTVPIVVLVGVSHLFVDAVTARFRPRETTSTVMFLGDQLLHLLFILVGWSLLDPSTWTVTPVAVVVGGTPSWTAMTTGAVYLSAFVFVHEGGNAIVRGVLPADGPESDEDDLEAGSLIGSLERWIVLLLGLVGRWEAVALVVGVKSIARFEELKKRAFAEYFLVGTLTSVLVAIVVVVLSSLLV